MILEALFANDSALMGHKESDLQLIADKLVEASHLFSLTISLGKTEVLLWSAPGSTILSPLLSIEGATLKTVERFKYLGSIISSECLLDKEISERICKTIQALGYLCAWVLNQFNIWHSTKLKVYKAFVLTTLFYGCETWMLYRRQSLTELRPQA